MLETDSRIIKVLCNLLLEYYLLNAAKNSPATSQSPKNHAIGAALWIGVGAVFL